MVMNAAVARDTDPTYARYYVNFSFNVTYNNAGNRSKRYQPAVIVEGTPGQRIEISMNSESAQFSSADMAGWDDGNADFTFNRMGCGNNTIMVGSYTTMDSWAAFAGTYTYQDPMIVGEISDFSSYGTGYDGRKFPVVCAPGAAIISSYNSYLTDGDANSEYSAQYTFNGRKYYWHAEQGTSMAAPAAAGIVATWLQADPTLTVERVREILKSTSVRDASVEAAADRFGYGKINAWEGIKTLAAGGVNDIMADNSDKVMINPIAANLYDVFVPGAKAVSIAVYNMTGALVHSAVTAGDNAQADLNTLRPGVYLLSVNNQHTQRLLVK